MKPVMKSRAQRNASAVYLWAAVAALLFMGASPLPTPVVVDGSALPSSALATINDKAYVALRPVGQALGAQVNYDGKLRRVTVTTEFREVVLVVGKAVAFVNGERRSTDAPAIVFHGRVMVPLRALAQAIGASVRYDSASRSVVVSTAGINSAVKGGPTAPPAPSTNTLQGTVTDVRAQMVPPAVAVDVDHLNYTITVPENTKIQFRDTHGSVTGQGPLSQVRPGDTLIATLNATGNLISIADIYAGFSGTIASVSGQNMVLTNGHVVESDKSQTAVALDGKTATFADLKAGDLVTVRADPRTGKVRDVVALTPGGMAISATATPSAPGGAADVKIIGVVDDAQHAFRVGQTLHVTMEGTAGGTATFDLSNVVVDNPMTETRFGHYEGAYHVDVGTNLVNAPIIVHLVKNGLTAQAVGPDPLAIITTPPSVKDAKPDPDAQVNNPRPNIYVTFSSVGDRGLDAQSLKLVVNGKNVTAQATRTSAFISYVPPGNLDAGPVSVELSGADTAGNPLYYKWTFVVVK
jgi:hypothetical protein